MIRNGNETDRVPQSETKDCGLIDISQVGASTRQHLDRIFSSEQFKGFKVYIVSFSTLQADHVSLELAFYRAKNKSVIPVVEVGTTRGVAVTEQAVLLATLPTREDANKAVGTVFLVHDRLPSAKAAEITSSITQIALQVRRQLV